MECRGFVSWCILGSLAGRGWKKFVIPFLFPHPSHCINLKSSIRARLKFIWMIPNPEGYFHLYQQTEMVGMKFIILFHVGIQVINSDRCRHRTTRVVNNQVSLSKYPSMWRLCVVQPRFLRDYRPHWNYQIILQGRRMEKAILLLMRWWYDRSLDRQQITHLIL